MNFSSNFLKLSSTLSKFSTERLLLDTALYSYVAIYVSRDLFSSCYCFKFSFITWVYFYLYLGTWVSGIVICIDLVLIYYLRTFIMMDVVYLLFHKKFSLIQYINIPRYNKSFIIFRLYNIFVLSSWENSYGTFF